MKSRAKAWALASPHAGALLDATDWSATPLGAMALWPDSLRQAASICLSSRLPMFVWWGEGLHGIYNDAYIPLLGQRHPAAFGRPAQQVWADIWDVVGPQADQVMRHGTSTWNERVLLVTRRNGDAEEAWFTWSYSPIFDGDGGVGGLFCACTEDTAQVRAERERDAVLQAARQEAIEHALAERRLRESEQRFRSATLLASSIVWTNDASGRMVGDQPGWQGFTGQSLEACQGYGWSDAVHPQDGPATMRAWHEAVARQGEFRHRHRVQRADGEYRVCDIRAVPLLDERGVLREWVGVHTDITERLAFDEKLQHSLAAEQAARGDAEHANRMKDEFLATLSHELRTPLSVILGWVALLRRRGELPEDIERGVTVIERNARAQSEIIADLLDMSAIVSGKVRLELTTVDLQTFVALAVETMRPTAAASGIAIAFTPDAQQPTTVMADPNRLQQILWNLLSNAVKFTGSGGHIGLALTVDRPHAVLQVSDDGEGISPDFMTYIFDRFRQADASTTRSRGGLGLGLSIVKKLAELHEGTIEAHSAGLGHGSVFTLRLPLAGALEMPAGFGLSVAPATPAAAAPLALAPSAEAVLQGLRVLLVDDDADGRETTKSLLEHQRVAVTPAASAAEALSWLARSAFDVVISDIGMPQVDGYGFVRQLRALETRRQAPPIAAIALTAFARPEDQVKAIDAGFDLHLAKPIDPSQLYAALLSTVRSGAR